MEGFILIFSAPVGAGKTTIVDEISKLPGFVKPVSATTRPPRQGEIDGTDYFFVSSEEFKRMQDNGELLESVEFNGNMYGTVRKQVETAVRTGKIVLFALELRGFQVFKSLMPDSVTGVFILPPTMEELKKRSILRGDDEKTVTSRMEIAKNEVKNYPFYDYTVVNDDLQTCISEIKAIITAERLRSSRRKGHDQVV